MSAVIDTHLWEARVAERRNKGEQHGNWREIGLMAMADGFEDPTVRMSEECRARAVKILVC